jgi:hypothetical protein
MFNDFFKSFLSIKYFLINSHVPMIYYKPYDIKNILYFQHQIKLSFLNMKN